MHPLPLLALLAAAPVANAILQPRIPVHPGNASIPLQLRGLSDAVFRRQSQCVDAGYSECDSYDYCCPSGGFCCGADTCCDAGQVCCGNGCVPADAQCCDTGDSCPTGTDCYLDSSGNQVCCSDSDCGGSGSGSAASSSAAPQASPTVHDEGSTPAATHNVASKDGMLGSALGAVGVVMVGFGML